MEKVKILVELNEKNPLVPYAYDKIVFQKTELTVVALCATS